MQWFLIVWQTKDDLGLGTNQFHKGRQRLLVNCWSLFQLLIIVYVTVHDLVWRSVTVSLDMF